MSPFRIAAWAVPLVLLLALAYVLSGGAANRDPADRDLRPPPSRISDEGFPRVVALPDRTELSLARAPRRIVVANTALLDAVVALVGSERIAALPRQAKTWSSIARAPEAFAEVPTFGAFVAETILAREPDLVLCSVHSPAETVAVLRDLDVPIARFEFPEDLDDVRAQLRLVAELLGAERRLGELESELEGRIEDLRSSPGERTGLTVAFYTHDGNEGWSSGAGTIADEVISLAGMRNATAFVGHFGPVRLTFEHVLAIDPDVLVVPEAFGEVDAATDRVLAEEPALAGLRAVRDGRIVHLHPCLFSTTSHEAITAAEELARSVDRLLAGEGEHR